MADYSVELGRDVQCRARLTAWRLVVSGQFEICCHHRTCTFAAAGYIASKLADIVPLRAACEDRSQYAEPGWLGLTRMAASRKSKRGSSRPHPSRCRSGVCRENRQARLLLCACPWPCASHPWQACHLHFARLGVSNSWLGRRRPSSSSDSSGSPDSPQISMQSFAKSARPVLFQHSHKESAAPRDACPHSSPWRGGGLSISQRRPEGRIGQRNAASGLH